MTGKDKPDNVADNPHSLPYASNVGAPVIRPNNDLGAWKHGAVHAANKHYRERYDEIKLQFQELVEEFKWNDLIFNSVMRFKPVIGKTYYLYLYNDKHQMSLFSPEERIHGHDGYIGAFRLNYDNRWEQVKQ